MKFTLSWLKDHLETGASLQEITEAALQTIRVLRKRDRVALREVMG